jgi:hypothetical protein
MKKILLLLSVLILSMAAVVVTGCQSTDNNAHNGAATPTGDSSVGPSGGAGSTGPGSSQGSSH